MECSFCHHELPDGSLFCNICGTRLTTAPLAQDQPQAQPREHDESTTVASGPSSHLIASNASPHVPSAPLEAATSEPTVRSSVTLPDNTDATVRVKPSSVPDGSADEAPPSAVESTVEAAPAPVAPTQYAQGTPPPPPVSSPLPSFSSSEVHTSYTPPPPFPTAPTPPPPSYSVGATPPPPSYSPSGVHPAYPQQPYYSGIHAPITRRPAPVVPAEPNAGQRLLIRLFQPALAGNPFMGIIVGGLLAAFLSVLTFWLLIPLTNAFIPHAQHSNPVDDQRSAYNWLLITPLQSSFREGMELLLVAHGATTHIQTQYVDSSSGASGNTAVESQNTVFPLHGLLFLPALFLILGGYLAACSDFSDDRPLQSLVRGAAIAVPYTLLLLLISTQVNGIIPSMSSASSSAANPILSVDIGSILLAGLLWGVLFGLIGASLKLARGQWRVMFYSAVQRARYYQVFGVTIGGIVATLLGIALTLLLVLAALAFTTFSVPFLTKNVCTSGITGSWQSLTFWGLAQAPLHAIMLFAMALGAPATLRDDFLGPPQEHCFTLTTSHPTISVGLLSGIAHPAAGAYLLLLLPAISLFIGGRLSAALCRARASGPAAVQGALIAIPFTILMLLLSLLATDTFSFSSNSISNGAAGGVFQSNPTLSIVVNPGDVLLWALIFGALFGALGGVYQVSTFKAPVSGVLRALALPAVLLSKPVFFLLDLLTGRPRTQPRSQARDLLYGALLLALLMLILAIIGGFLLISLNATLSASANRQLHDILSALLIALPGLLLISAASAALSYDASLTPPPVADTPPQPPIYHQPGMVTPPFPPAQGGIV